MKRVFTVRKGDVIRIGNFGLASNGVPAMVPAAVAETLAVDVFRVENEPARGVVDVQAEPVPEPVAAPGKRK